MAGILSQDEVDALLQAVEDGDVELGAGQAMGGTVGDFEVTEYSFRRPNLLTRDQLRLFNTLHDHFTGEAQSRLSLSLRTTSEMRLVASDQLQYGEFILSLPDVTHLLVLSLDPGPGYIILEVGLPFIFTIVDVILGGTGTTPMEHRGLTDMESAIAEPILDELVTELERCLAHITECKLTRQRVESSPQYVQAVPADTASMVMTFEVRVGEGAGVINVCYPIPVVERLLVNVHGRGGEGDLFREEVDTKQQGDRPHIGIDDIPVTLTAILGGARITVRDLVNLRQGDVLVIDSPITALTRVDAEGVPQFFGRPGNRHGKLVVKVTGYCSKKQRF